MVHPNFAAQRIPRPAQWEVPQLDERQDFNVAPTALADSISDRLLNFLRTGQLDLKSWDPASDHHDGDASAAFRSRLHDFLRFKPDIADSQEWESDRLLGRGGFGRVGLWVQRDANGVIVDEVVVKEMRPGPRDNGLCFINGQNIPVLDVLQEPVLQKLVNQTGCENFTHIRSYKVDRGGRIPTARPRRVYAGPHRLYLEYAPYGTLTTLIDRYRAWSQHIPEPFLWHVFHSLAHALKAMQQKPADCRVAGEDITWHSNAEIVHYDIKSDNIFLGYENLKDETLASTGGSRKLPYPTIKLSDLGISRVTHSDDDANNPWLTWRSGTDFFRPPEALHYGIGFEEPPNGPYRPIIDRLGNAHDIVREEEDLQHAAATSGAVAANFKFLASANVWCVGKIMYDLATLSYEYSLQVNWGWRESEYRRNNHHLLPDYNSTPFGFMHHDNVPHNPGYGDDLMKLIGRCLEPRITSRISVDDLITEVNRHLPNAEHDEEDDATNDNRPMHDVERRRVYYRGNEINAMPLGNTPFRARADEVAGLLDARFDDPSWPPIQLPASKWQNHVQIATATTPAPAAHNYNISNGRIWFVNGPPPQPPATTVTDPTQSPPFTQQGLNPQNQPQNSYANPSGQNSPNIRNNNAAAADGAANDGNTSGTHSASHNNDDPQWRGNNAGSGSNSSNSGGSNRPPGSGAVVGAQPQDQGQHAQTDHQDDDLFGSLIQAMIPQTPPQQQPQQQPQSQGPQQSQPQIQQSPPQVAAQPQIPPPSPQGQPRRRRRAPPSNQSGTNGTPSPPRRSARIAQQQARRQPQNAAGGGTVTTAARGRGQNANRAGRAQGRGRGRARGRGQGGN